MAVYIEAPREPDLWDIYNAASGNLDKYLSGAKKGSPKWAAFFLFQDKFYAHLELEGNLEKLKDEFINPQEKLKTESNLRIAENEIAILTLREYRMAREIPNFETVNSNLSNLISKMEIAFSQAYSKDHPHVPEKEISENFSDDLGMFMGDITRELIEAHYSEE